MGFTQEQVRNAKICTKCGEEKSCDNGFYRDGSRLRAECKRCTINSRAEFRKANSERVNASRRLAYRSKDAAARRAQTLMSYYGLTVADVEKYLERQNGCAVCHRSEPGTSRWWHVDHDHSCCPESARSCGQCVRGILCHRCNLMLGQARDSVETLRSAIDYLGG